MKKNILSTIFLALAALSFSSCEPEDTEGQCCYQAGITAFSGDALSGDLKFISDTYNDALEITDTYFIMYGTPSECDKKVKSMAQKAEILIEQKDDWTDGTSFTYSVRRIVLDSNNYVTVYSYSYGQP